MSTFEKNDKNQAVITIEIDGESFNKAEEEAFKKTSGKYTVAGFRRGKAPRRLIEQYYGAGVFFDDAFNDICGTYYSTALDEHNLTPVSRPEIEIVDIKDDKTVIFTATVDLKPEVELGKYTGIKIKKNEYTVSDEDINKEIESARERVSRMVGVERPAANGDTVELDYSGSVDGVKFPGGTAEKQSLVLGSGSFIPGFEEQVVGMNIGDEKDITVKFPDDYHAEDLKGKEAVFAIKIHGIQEKQVPAVDDDFAKDVSEFDTLEAYKDDIKAGIAKRNEERAESEFENALIDKICDGVTVVIPDSMIDRQLDYQINDMRMRLSYQNISLEDYLKYTGGTMEKLRETYRDDALNTVKKQLVLEAIRKAENISADENDIEAEIATYAERIRRDVEDVKKELGASEREYFEDSAVIKKIIDFLKENNKPAKKAAKKAEDADKTDNEEKKSVKKADDSAVEEKKPAKKPAKKAADTAADAEKKPAKKSAAKSAAKNEEA